MTGIKPTLVAIFFLTIATRCAAQSEANLLGRWVNTKDTTEYIILSGNGEFKMVSYDFNDGGPRVRTGMWMYKSAKRRLILFYGPKMPRQYYKLRGTGGLDYTLHQDKREIVFVKRGISPDKKDLH